MPARNSRKVYIPNGFYHLYNRGVEKRIIFIDRQDHNVFLGYLKEYLSPKNEVELKNRLADPQISYKERDKILKQLRLNNFASEICLLAYCLMPNHFHFLIKQKSAESIDNFMNSLGTRYTMYFNKKYKRVGSLYQGVYKAVQVVDEYQFVYLSKYIHKQALALQNIPSSYQDYLDLKNTSWVNPREILTYFSQIKPNLSYQAFVEKSEDLENIKSIFLE